MNFVLKILLVAAFFNGLSWILLIPIWQYPDEQAHFAQVQNFAEIGHVPALQNTSQEIFFSEESLGTLRDQFGNNKFTYHPEFKLPFKQSLDILDKSARTSFVISESTNNPPFYYLLGAIAYKVVNDGSLFSRVYAVRFLSVILYILNVIIVYKISEIIFKKADSLKFSLTILVSFMPMYVFASTGILPDPLTNLLFNTLILLNLLIITKGLKTSYLLSLVTVVILGICTRQQFLISIAICALAIFYQVSKNAKQLFYFLIILFLLIFLIIFLNYRGTEIPLVSNIRIPDSMIFDKKYLSLKQFSTHIWWTLNHTYREVLPWYWGVYKWLSLTLPHTVYQIINRLLVLATIGIFLRFVIVIRSKRISELDKILVFMIISSFIYFLFFLIWDYFFRSKNLFSFGVQGRYFFPIITAHFTTALIGFWQLFSFISKKTAKYLIFILTASMILLNDFSLAFVAASYYDTTGLKKFFFQVSQYKPLLLKGDIIIIILAFAFISQVFLLFYYLSMVHKNNVDIM